ncbi:MAG: 50S ribosomal protein L11 methyltransferase [Flavobacteriales bacterium]|nr:50S ribosomal protein L11 methyltransferase [Flavobacteriales bacterium]|tara:strand:- start:982 stop:1806 length:825 start_codon:yes stop_codon:yes gene_type:complete
MNYIELSFVLQDKDFISDIVAAKLNEIEFESYVVTEDGVNAYIQEKFYNKDKLNLVLSDLENLFSFNYSIKYINQENWNSNWEKNFEPVEINEKCVIRAHFHETVGCKYEIVITPKMSFGTGHHETTFLMINEMFCLNFKGKSVLDIGCGTGVLAILSKMLGSEDTLGIDINEWSYENSKENAVLNNIDSIEFLLGDISRIKGDFDIVLANINRNVILYDIDKYYKSMKENSDLILSGFLSDDVTLIREKAESLGLSLVSQKNKDKWNLLHFIK